MIPGVFVSASLGKLILALIHNSYTNLIHGGEIDVSINKKDDASEIIVSANGPSVKLDSEKIEILNGNTNIAISTSKCIAYYSRSLIEHLNIDLKIESSEDNVRYIINF